MIWSWWNSILFSSQIENELQNNDCQGEILKTDEQEVVEDENPPIEDVGGNPGDVQPLLDNE